MRFKLSSNMLVFPDWRKQMSLSIFKIERPKLPKRVVIPLLQHENASVVPLVKKYVYVKTGQMIGEPENDRSAAVHASVSGTVLSLAFFPHAKLGETLAVEIESDGNDTPAFNRSHEPAVLSGEEITAILKNSGIVEEERPLHAVWEGKQIHTLVLNCVESEPYLTRDYIAAMERTYELIQGAKMLKKATGARRVIFAVAHDKQDALETLNSKLFSLGEEFIEAKSFPLRYPQDQAERLMKDLFYLDLKPGEDPSDHGVALINTMNVISAYDMVKSGKPCYEQLMTVTGECLAQPKNLLARIGMSAAEVIKNCQGYLRPPAKLVAESLMRGYEISNTDSPVTKGMKGLIALPPEEVSKEEASPCIRCGWCIDACPSELDACQITLASEIGEFSLSHEHGVSRCTSCGNCEYVCPSKRPMMELINRAKMFVRA